MWMSGTWKSCSTSAGSGLLRSQSLVFGESIVTSSCQRTDSMMEGIVAMLKVGSLFMHGIWDEDGRGSKHNLTH